MIEVTIFLLSILFVVSTTLYIVSDARNHRRMTDAEYRINLCSKQVESFNNNVGGIQKRLSSIENRLNIVEQNVCYSKRHDLD